MLRMLGLLLEVIIHCSTTRDIFMRTGTCSVAPLCIYWKYGMAITAPRLRSRFFEESMVKAEAWFQRLCFSAAPGKCFRLEEASNKSNFDVSQLVGQSTPKIERCQSILPCSLLPKYVPITIQDYKNGQGSAHGCCRWRFHGRGRRRHGYVSAAKVRNSSTHSSIFDTGPSTKQLQTLQNVCLDTQDCARRGKPLRSLRITRKTEF